MKIPNIHQTSMVSLVALALLCGWTRPISAALFTGSDGSYTASSGSLNTLIPDYPGGGLAYTLNFNDTGLQLSTISVTLNISGGRNGDLYAYLSHGDSVSVLLNRIGGSTALPYGSDTSGFNVTLGMGTVNDIHTTFAGNPVLGNYSADGRVDYTSTTRENTLNVFSGADPAGTWTLFFADMSGGSVSTLNGWSVDINAVPEPVNVALGIFGAVIGLVGVVRWRARTRL